MSEKIEPALTPEEWAALADDLKMLRYVVGSEGPWSTGPLDELESLADRIEAMLPPS